MSPGLAESLDHQIRCAVDHRRVLGEGGRAADEAAELQAAREPAEIAAAGGLGLGQDVEGAKPRRLLALLLVGQM